MGSRANERGNTLLIATVLVLAMTVASLGAAKFLRQQTASGAELRFAGYPATQALYAAEKGVNALLYENNRQATPSDTPEIPSPASWTREIDYSTVTITQRVGYRIERLGTVSEGIHRFEITGEAEAIGGTSGWPAITRTLQVDVASGSNWVLQRYEQK